MARLIAMVRSRPTLAFYGVVLVFSLVGAVTSAESWLQWWMPAALLAVGAVEIGGVVISNFAERRRNLGETAFWARLLSACIAAGAVAVQWFGHDGPARHQQIQAGFFAGLSLLGYLVYLLDTAAKRRDALRAKGRLDDPPPVYGVWQWLRHPVVTRRARLLALANIAQRTLEVADKPAGTLPTTPILGRLASLEAARQAERTEKREAAISSALHDRIKAAAGDTMAAIAVTTYDLDEVAKRLAKSADYDGLAALLAADLTAAKLAGKETAGEAPADNLTALVDATAPTLDEQIEAAISRVVAATPRPESGQVSRHGWTRKITERRSRRMGRPQPQITVVLPDPKPARPPASPAAKRPNSAASRGRPSAAQKVAAAAAKLPGAKPAEIAKAARVSEDTVRRHLATVGSINGHSHTQED